MAGQKTQKVVAAIKTERSQTPTPFDASSLVKEALYVELLALPLAAEFFVFRFTVY